MSSSVGIKGCKVSSDFFFSVCSACLVISKLDIALAVFREQWIVWVIGRWDDFYMGKGERRNEGYGDIRENQEAL